MMDPLAALKDHKAPVWLRFYDVEKAWPQISEQVATPPLQDILARDFGLFLSSAGISETFERGSKPFDYDPSGWARDSNSATGHCRESHTARVGNVAVIAQSAAVEVVVGDRARNRILIRDQRREESDPEVVLVQHLRADDQGGIAVGPTVGPDPQKRVHYVVIPKKDITDVGALSDEDKEYLIDLFAVIQELVNKQQLTNYEVITNGPGKQTMTYLHFHLIAE